MALIKNLLALKADKRGVSALEYGLMCSFIALAIVGGVTLFGSAVDKFFNTLSLTVGAFRTTGTTS